jgi:hypothetical protein
VRVSKKRKAAAAVARAPAPKKAMAKQKHMKGSSHSVYQTSEQEKLLAKPLKASKKFRSQSSGFSILEKASSAKATISEG